MSGESARIVDQLTRAFDGDPWYGSPLLKILDGVTAAQASARPIAVAHTIWELVLHITGWKGEVMQRLRGQPAGDPPEGDWPKPAGTDEAAWQAALTRLRQVHQALVREVAAASEEQLSGAVRDERNPALGTGLTQWQTLYGIVQHDVYHTGQISLLKKAVSDKR